MTSMIAYALNREEIFGLPQWMVGSGLVALVSLALLTLPDRRGIKILTSLQVTIWTLAISVALVFLGSIAQVPEGLWDAQARWFKSWFVFRQPGDVWWVPPIFPGGHLLGTILLVNLLAAHTQRFSRTFQKVGIQITHIGIIMLLVGQFFTDELAVESMLSFREGETKQYSEHHRDHELAITTDAGDGNEQVVAIPQALVADKSDIQNPALPFVVRVHQYEMNGDVLDRSEVLKTRDQLKGALEMMAAKYGSGDVVELAKEAQPVEGRAEVFRQALRKAGESDVSDIVAAAGRVAGDAGRLATLRADLQARFRDQMLDANIRRGEEGGFIAEALKSGRDLSDGAIMPASTDGTGARAVAVPRPESHDDNIRNVPYAVVEVLESGKSLGRYLVSAMLRGQEVKAGGKTWTLSMRPERYYLPFTMKLVKATHDVYPGTDIPKDYRSRVRLNNPGKHEDREVEIYMNQPLRYEGLTFYQSQMGQDQRNEKIKTSGLQVVSNPSWLTPYAACLVVGLGMLWQFLWHLSKFFSKRMGIPAPEVASPHPILPIAALVFVVPDLWVLFHGIQAGSGMAIVAACCTLFLRVLIAWQLARGRYLGFALVFVAVTTVLILPFAAKYRDTVGPMLWPLVVAQTLVVAAVVTAILQRPQPAETIA